MAGIADARPLLSSNPASPHRRAAERILWAGGDVTVSADKGNLIPVKGLASLPETFSVRGIDLRRCCPDSGVDLTGVDALETLESLILRGQYAIPADLLREVTKCPSLVAIDLAHTANMNDGLDGLPNLPGLTSLDLSFTHVNDAGLAHLKGCKALRSFALVATRVSDEGMRYLAEMDHLEELNLRGAGITDDGVAYLRNVPNLRRLVLDYLPITDAALEHLRGLPNLAYLSLMHTRVSDQGLASLTTSENLREINVVGTAVTSAGVDRLRQAVTPREIVHGIVPAIDLLPRIDPDRDSLRGKWMVRQGAVVSPKKQKGNSFYSCLQVHFSPPGEYVLEAIVHRESGSDNMTFGVIVHGHQTSVTIDSHPGYGHVTGLALLDGRNTPENETGRTGQLLYTDSEPTTVLITVRGNAVTVTCGDVLLVDWQGDCSRLSLHPAHRIASKEQLFLVSYSDSFTVSKLTVTPIAVAGERRAPVK